MRFNGANRTTDFNSVNQLTAHILSTDIPVGSAGLKDITVFNPLPVGGLSNTIKLNVDSGIPTLTPRISSISPVSMLVGTPYLTLTVNSDNASFGSGAVVRVDGSDRTTTPGASQLIATLLSGDVAVVAQKTITVFNPGGGGVSNAFPLTITTPGTGLKGEYFNNTTVSGTPILSRTDSTVDFNWDIGSAGLGVTKNTFSARWTGQVLAPITAKYKFHTFTNDGVRLWVNDQVMFDHWVDQPFGVEWTNRSNWWLDKDTT